MGMRPNAATGYPGRTHRFYTGSTVFKFGDGLSYSTWAHTPKTRAVAVSLAAATVQLEATRDAPHKAASLVTVEVDVANRGPLRGDHVALAFLSAPRGVAGVDGVPLQSLATYERVADVAVGTTRRVVFNLTAHHLAGALGSVRGAKKSGAAAYVFALKAGTYTLRVGSGTEAVTIDVILA